MQTQPPKPPKQLNQSSAWACLMTNLLVLPGLGSWIAGQREALAQIVVGVAGMIGMTVWLVWFAVRWIQLEKAPPLAGPMLWLGVLGMVMFILAWSWSLVSSAILVRAARQRGD